MPNVTIDDTSYTGQYAEITYCPPDGGTPIYLGYHQLPFDWITTIYIIGGSFSIYYPSLAVQCGECITTSTTSSSTSTTSTTTTGFPCECVTISNAQTCVVEWINCDGTPGFNNDWITNPVLSLCIQPQTLNFYGLYPICNPTIEFNGGCSTIVDCPTTTTTTTLPCYCYYIEVVDGRGATALVYEDCYGNNGSVGPGNAGLYCIRSVISYGTGTATPVGGLCEYIGKTYECPTTTTTSSSSSTTSSTSSTTTTTTTNVIPLEEFYMLGTNARTITLSNVTSYTTEFFIDWGDGNVITYPPGSNINIVHTYDVTAYPSGFNGIITLKAVDLTDIQSISTSTNQNPVSQTTLTFFMDEIAKLDNATDFGSSFYGGKYTGQIENLPNTVQVFNVLSNDLTGSIDGFSSYAALTVFQVLGTNTISGDILNFPSGLNTLVVWGSNSLTGSISTLPASLTYLDILSSNNTLYGDIKYLPENLTYASIDQGVGVFTYSGSKVWPAGMNRLYIRNTGYSLSSGTIDLILQDLNSITWAGGVRALALRGTLALPNTDYDNLTIIQSVTITIN